MQISPFFSFVFCLITAFPCFAAKEMTSTLLDQGKVYCLESRTQQKRSNSSFSIMKTTHDHDTIFHLSQKGGGNYHKFKNVRWVIHSHLTQKSGLKYPLWTELDITDERSNILEVWNTRFNYNKKRIVIHYTNRVQNTKKTFRFPLHPETVDYSTLNNFLQDRMPQILKGTYKSFYMISAEPKMYQVNIKLLEQEILDLPAGKFEAQKLKLIPDFGILDGIVDKIIPETLIWFESKPPYRWLKYQGLEIGLGSTYIEAFLE